jgi:adenosine kinase
MAALVMETTGTQEYEFKPERFLARISESYGAQAAAEVSARVSLTSPALVKEKV